MTVQVSQCELKAETSGLLVQLKLDLLLFSCHSQFVTLLSGFSINFNLIEQGGQHFSRFKILHLASILAKDISLE